MLVIPRKENVCLESLGKEFAKRLGFDEWWRCGILMKEWWHLLKLGTGVGRKWVFFERHDKNERLDGELKIESTAGIGTRVTAIINMPPQNKAKECENGKD